MSNGGSPVSLDEPSAGSAAAYTYTAVAKEEDENKCTAELSPWVSYIRLPKLACVPLCCEVSHHHLVVGSDTGHLLVFDRRKYHDMQVTSLQKSPITSLALSTLYAVCASADQVHVYDLDNAFVKWSFDFHRCLSLSVAESFNYRGGTIILGDSFRLGSVKRPLTARTGTPPTFETIHQGEGSIDAIRCSRNGELVAWHNERGIKVYDVMRNEKVTTLTLEGQLVRLCWADSAGVACGENGIMRLYVTCDNTVRLMLIHPRGSRHRGEFVLSVNAPGNQVVCGVCPDSTSAFHFLVLTCDSCSHLHLFPSQAPSVPQEQEVKAPEESAVIEEKFSMWQNSFLVCYDEDAIYVVVQDSIRRIIRRKASVHAQWFADQGRFEEAIEVGLGALESFLPSLLLRIASNLLQSNDTKRALDLIHRCKNAQISAITPQLWEDLTLLFSDYNRLELIALIIPHQVINFMMADLIVRKLLHAPIPDTLLKLVDSWPQEIYSVDAALVLASERMNELPVMINATCHLDSDYRIFHVQFSDDVFPSREVPLESINSIYAHDCAIPGCDEKFSLTIEYTVYIKSSDAPGLESQNKTSGESQVASVSSPRSTSPLLSPVNRDTPKASSKAFIIDTLILHFADKKSRDKWDTGLLAARDYRLYSMDNIEGGGINVDGIGKEEEEEEDNTAELKELCDEKNHQSVLIRNPAREVLTEIVLRLYIFKGDVAHAFQVAVDTHSVTAALNLLEHSKSLFVSQYANEHAFEVLTCLDPRHMARVYMKYYPVVAPVSEVFERLDVKGHKNKNKTSPSSCCADFRADAEGGKTKDDARAEGKSDGSTQIAPAPHASTPPPLSLYLYCKQLLVHEKDKYYRGTALNAKDSLRCLECLRLYGNQDDALLNFLRETHAYNVDDALALLRSPSPIGGGEKLPRNIAAEAHLLGRSGRTEEALELLLSDDSDTCTEKAAEFIRWQNDDKKLWEQFLRYAQKDPKNRIAKVLAQWDMTTPISIAEVIQSIDPGNGIPEGLAKVYRDLSAELALDTSLHVGRNHLAEIEIANLGKDRYKLRHRGSNVGTQGVDSMGGIVVSMKCFKCGHPLRPGETIVAGYHSTNVMHESCAQLET